MMYRKIIIALFFLVPFYGCMVEGIQTPFQGGMFASIQKKHLSDAWYPSKKTLLLQRLKDLNTVARKNFSFHVDPSSIRAIVVPHAGYDYSGAVATSAYQSLKPGFFNRIIIVAPSHHVAFEGVALPGSQYKEFKSPLGLISFDQPAMKKLKKMSPEIFVHRHQVHELEHAVEVQIPFIQNYCGSCSIIPLIVGSVSEEQIESVANCLASIIDQNTLVVISSDFTHHGAMFGYQPFTHNILLNIFKLDSSLVQALQAHDLKIFRSVLDRTGDTVCGKYPLMILLSMLKKKCFTSKESGDVESYVVGYDTSAQQQENPEHCVSYVGMVFSTQQKKDVDLEDQLTGYEKQFLLHIGRKAVNVAVTLKREKSFDEKMYEQYIPGVLTKSLQEKQAAFVTLYVGYDKKLRGCIGTTYARVPLYQEVWDKAISAALHDTRFNPVNADELPKISLEISVLTKPEVVNSVQSIRLGTDGIILHSGQHQAVYLPEVATDQGWNLEQTFASLSQKAGLGIDAWKDKNTTFERFQTIHIVQ